MNKLTKLFRHSLFKGSFIMVGGSFLASAVNYFTNTQVGRLLGPEEYGAFMALISLMMIITVINNSLNTTIMKFVSQFKGKQEEERAVALWLKFTKTLFFVGAGLFLLISLSSPLVANFLRLRSVAPVFALAFVIWASLVALPATATLNGWQKFFQLTLYQFLSALVKLAVALGLIWAGWQAGGALLAFGIASLAPLILLAPAMRKKIASGGIDQTAISLRKPLRYAIPVTFATLGLTLLFTADVVLAKRFLPPREAGFYSGLAVIGRVITFATAPIALVMFPLVSERRTQNRPYFKILLLAGALVTTAGMIASAGYFLFPRAIVGIFFGEQFAPATPFLGWFGLLLTLYSLCNLFTQFLLSVENRLVGVATVGASLFQLGGIAFFHQNIPQLLTISFVALGTLLAILLALTAKTKTNNARN